MNSERGDFSRRLPRVLWLGGVSGVGKTRAARSLARRYDVRLYSMDARVYEHAARLPPNTRSVDEMLVDSTPEALADWFEDSSRVRFPLVVDDLLALKDDAPVVVDGHQLLPELVAPQTGSSRQALFVVAEPRLQRRIGAQRGLLVYSQTRDPQRARANRLRRDELLVERCLRDAREHGLVAVEVADPTETEPLVEGHFEAFLSDWTARGDRGDVAARRRDENDARLRYWRAYARCVPEAAEGEIAVACECARSGCLEAVWTGLMEAETARAAGVALVAERHR